MRTANPQVGVSRPPAVGKISIHCRPQPQGIAVTDLLALVAPLSTLEPHQWVGITGASAAGTAGIWIVILAIWGWARR